MARRASWKGFLKVSLVSCPVEFYPATSDNEKTSFRQVNRNTKNRVLQLRVDRVTGTEVAYDDIVKGYEVGKEEFILLEKTELDELKVESTKTVAIESFVQPDSIDPTYLEKSYFIAPDGKVGQDAFAVMREAMRQKGLVGIGTIVLTSREHPIMIEPFGKGMRAFTLRYPNEVRGEGAVFDDIPDVRVDPELLELAGKILDDRAGDFDPSAFRDRYEEAVVELIKAKQLNRPLPVKEDKPTVQSANLMDALRASIKDSRKASKPVTKEPVKAAPRKRKAA
jgi:DNA end-binding protein Ku